MTTKKSTLTCFDVANYFLSLSGDESSGDYISNMKLQKLVYYAQGLHLAMYDKPLFDDVIEAWTYGPVIHALYNNYKGNGDKAIPKPDSINLSIYSTEVRSLLDDIYVSLGQFSAWKLATMTHEESPWVNAYRQSPGTTITQLEMKNFFKSYLK
ncbi:MAG TPA: hypothetical protein DCR59_02070 [Dehalococcoidia bacterium]|nr:hypothetical protein [Dehalococcoidia bacterium]